MFPSRQILRKAEGEGGEGGGGGSAAPWYGSDANKAVADAKQFKGVDDVFTWGTNLEKLVGAERAGRTVVLPKDDKDADGIKAFRSKIGVPDKADDYKLLDHDGKATEFSAWAQSTLHAAGVPTAAAQQIMKGYNEFYKSAIAKLEAEEQAAQTKLMDALKAKHGEQFSAKVELGKRAMQALGLDAQDVSAIEAASKSSGAVMDLLVRMGEKIGEPGPAGNGSGGTNTATERQVEAQKKLEALRADRIAGKVSDAQFEAESMRLGRIAYPDAA